MERKNKLFSSHFDENKTPILIIALYLAVIEHVVSVRQVRLLPVRTCPCWAYKEEVALGDLSNQTVQILLPISHCKHFRT